MNNTSFEKMDPKKRGDGKTYDCQTCGLSKYPINPKMEPYGNMSKGIMIIGEAPEQDEDEAGMPWQGKTGKLLQRYLRRIGIDLFEDCVCVNAVNCRPKGNKTPTNTEIACCREMIVRSAINRYMPHVIIPLGTAAVQSVIGDRWKRDLQGIFRWRGFTIPDRDFKCWICPTLHPSYIARMDDDSADFTWEQDLKAAISKAEEILPKKQEIKIEVISDLEPLNAIKTDQATIDFETTGLKPHATGHRIVCAAVAYDVNSAYTFMIPPTKKQRQPLFNFLTNPNIGKMGHNIKYEDTWANERWNLQIHPWEWDSMLAAHMIDNRSGITSLKFQTYVNFGIADYDSEIYPYMVGTEYKNANSFNRVQELVEEDPGAFKLMQYCAFDAIYEFRLAVHQHNIMDYSFLPF